MHVQTAGGTDDSLQDVFLELRAPLCHYVFRILRDREEAEDIAQEVFLRLLCAVSGGETIFATRSWLFQAARNLAIDHHRRSAHLLYLEEKDWKSTPETGPNAEERLIVRDRRQKVSAAICHLSPRERHCVQMRASGMLYREIAGVLGVRITSVENYWSRAVKKIHRCLAQPRTPAPEGKQTSA